MSGGLSLRLSIPTERLSIPPRSRKGGCNAGWLGKLDSPLRTDSASLKSLKSFRQWTSFCSSWILAVSSWIVSWFSINFLLESSSNLDPWNRFNSSVSFRLPIWASRRSRFCSDSCSCIRSWPRWSCSSAARVWSISFRWGSTIPFNSWILLLFLNIGSKISENLLLSFKEHPDCFVFHFATWFLSARTKFVHGSLRSCVCEKRLSWQQTFFIRVMSLSSVRWFSSLLNEQWWR